MSLFNIPISAKKESGTSAIKTQPGVEGGIGSVKFSESVKTSNHKYYANYKDRPAITDKDTEFGFYWAKSTDTPDTLGIDENRDVTIYQKGDTKHQVNVPINAIGWGHTRYDAIGSGSRENSRYKISYDKTSSGHSFDINKIKLGWTEPEYTPLGNLENIAPFNRKYPFYGDKPSDNATTIRNFYYIPFDAISTNYDSSDTAIEKSIKLSVFYKNYNKHRERINVVLPAGDSDGNYVGLIRKNGFRYTQVAFHNYRELDKQLIVTDPGVAAEKLHYITLVEIKIIIKSTSINSLYNAGRIEHLKDPNHKHKWEFDVNERNDVQAMIGYPNTSAGKLKDDYSIFVRALIDFSYDTTDLSRPTNVTLIDSDNIYPNVKKTRPMEKSQYGWDYCESTGYDSSSDSSKYWSHYYMKYTKGGGTAKNIYPELKITAPSQSKEIIEFGSYLTNNNLKLLVRYNGDSADKFNYTGTDWSKNTHTPIQYNFSVLDSNNDVEYGYNGLPLVLSKTKIGYIPIKDIGFGAIGDNAGLGNWLKIYADGGLPPMAKWNDGYTLPIGLKIPNDINTTHINVASTQTTNGGVTFDHAMFVLGDKIYSLVKTGTSNFWNVFPNTYTHQELDNIDGLKTIRNEYVSSVCSENVHDSNIILINYVSIKQSNDFYTFVNINYLKYEKRSPLSVILEPVETRHILNQGVKKPCYFIDITFDSDELAKRALQMVKFWKIFLTGDYNTDRIKHGTEKRKENKIELELDIYDDVTTAGGVLAANFYLHAIDETLTPFFAYSTGSADGRSINIGEVRIKHKDHWYSVPSWDGNNGYGSGIIHTMTSDLSSSNAFYIETGADIGEAGTYSDNIINCELEYYVSSENWFGNQNGYVKYYKIIKDDMNLLDQYIKLDGSFPEIPGLMIHGGWRNNFRYQSNNNSALDGTKYAPKLTFTSAAGERKSYALPNIVTHDLHNFIITPSQSNNPIEIDASGNTSLDAEVTNNSFYIGPNVSGHYLFSFNFRCTSPQVVDEQYSRFYENKSTTPISGRLSYPTISKWWIVGLPSDKQIYGLKLRYWVERDSHGRPIPIKYYFNGNIGENIDNKLWTNQKDIICFSNDHALGVVSNKKLYAKSVYKEYLTSESINKIINIVTQSSVGDPNYNDGVVWASGTFDPPKSYKDYTNYKFTHTYNNATLSSGIITLGRYGLVFIVEDTIGRRNGIDLVAANTRYQIRETNDKGPYSDVHFDY